MRLTLPILLSVMWFAAAASAQEAPPRPIPCSEPSPPPLIPFEAQLRQRLPIDLTPETTLDQVTSALGPLNRFGPGREMFIHSFSLGNELRLELWLSFDSSEPRRLRRALLHSYDRPYCGRESTNVLLNSLEVTKARRLDQLDYSRRLNAADVYAVWGPPDDEFGSGLQYWAYQMADGQIVTLLFDCGEVLGSGQRRARRRR